MSRACLIFLSLLWLYMSALWCLNVIPTLQSTYGPKILNNLQHSIPRCGQCYWHFVQCYRRLSTTVVRTMCSRPLDKYFWMHIVSLRVAIHWNRFFNENGMFEVNLPCITVILNAFGLTKNVSLMNAFNSYVFRWPLNTQAKWLIVRTTIAVYKIVTKFVTITKCPCKHKQILTLTIKTSMIL